MPPLAEIVDVEALASVVAASLIAGCGLSVAFALAIVCSTRAAELRRAGSSVAAAVLVAIAALAMLACLALVGFGIQVMASK